MRKEISEREEEVKKVERIKEELKKTEKEWEEEKKMFRYRIEILENNGKKVEKIVAK